MKIGIIGYGGRIQGIAKDTLRQDPACRIAAIVDPRNEAIQANRERLGLRDDVRYYGSAEEMLDRERLDGVMIGTRCSSHTEQALKVLPTGLPLFLEKPVSTNMADLMRLKASWEANPSPTVVSFPLRVTSIVQLVKEIIDSGKIGTVEHVQAVNNVPYGGVYFQHWYRDENETGGLFLQKATHDFDYINYVLGMKPTSVCAMISKQIFKGDKPAGLKCIDCDIKRTCPDSVLNTKVPHWEYCCYAEDTGNEDSGSALIRYESGMHVSYSQNFFVRNEAGARGARFMGYKGTVEFDFNTGIVKVYMHHTPRVETYELKAGDGHFGGDEALAASFVELMKGSTSSICSLEDGIRSALLCLKAKESALTGQFQAVEFDSQPAFAAK
ncbi:Gfo/Idh/MocA family protein [Paenibacillus montanisoli]|uniref:Gfo/Idh/MocA family oxidoreductase n=1 Tax=Paenibacillus montanisoli TaxID=2081970 RepID=A0A328U9X0_9BACL|nr:Gfo/Idh/MocA family oxidoreductase [Paenibacillus montanisoli]RAP77024.1 gfo/Idh/MocA family oxidoreductase [Paenibacillus montanisoli]